MYAYLFRRHPFIRILFALIVGITLETVFSPNLNVIIVLLGLLIILEGILRWLPLRFVWRRPVEGIILLSLIALLGAGLSADEGRLNELAFRDLKEGDYVLQVEDIPYVKNEKLRIRASLFDQDSLGIMYRSQLQISIEVDSLSRALRPGDLIFAGVKPIRVSSDGIPEGFDYAAYLRKQAIWFQASIKKNEWVGISGDSVDLDLTFVQEVAQIRHSLIRKMGAGGLDPPVQAFISALVLGFKRDLDPQLKEQFTSIGVVHVLAVSGLHIGIIYWVLQKLFFFLLMVKGGRFLNLIVVLGFLWFYVFLAGFSPSVLRAAFMFSLVQAARLINRSSSVFNVLAASAFILLVRSPSTLYDLGFLFSYLAVAGILMIQPVLLGFVEIKSKIFNYLWTMMALSISAQLLVTPLSIYYFHQFPLVFIVANLVMVPIVVAFIYPASLYILLPTGSWSAKMLEYVLEFGYSVIHWLSGFFESFPQAKMEDIPFDTIQLILWYVFIVFLLIFTVLRIPRSALILLFVVLLLIGNHWYERYKAERQSEFLVFYYQADWWIVLIEGRDAITLSQQASDSIVQQKLRNFFLSRRIENSNFYCLNDHTLFEDRNLEPPVEDMSESRGHSDGLGHVPLLSNKNKALPGEIMSERHGLSDGLTNVPSKTNKNKASPVEIMSFIKNRLVRVGPYLFWRDQVFHLAYLEKGKKEEALFGEVNYTIGGYARDSLPGHIKQITRYPSRTSIPVHAASINGAFFKKL